MILLHDVQHRFLGEPAMVLGKQFVHICELFIGHGHGIAPLAGMLEYTTAY
jgi:hypothetical protein